MCYLNIPSNVELEARVQFPEADRTVEYRAINGLDLKASRIGLGMWAMGGWTWGAEDEQESIRTIRTALDKGINLIDTAPVYGFGRSEEIVGKAIREHGGRDHVGGAVARVDDHLDAVEREAVGERALAEDHVAPA